MGKTFNRKDVTILKALPKRKKHYLQIVSPHPGKPLHLICLSNEILVIPQHYWFGRTIPCTAGSGQCEPCDANRAVRPYGYFAAVEKGGKRAVLVRVTDEALEHAPWALKDNGSHRGRFLRYERCGPSEKSRCRLFIDSEQRAKPENLGPEIDVLERLMDIWNAEEKEDNEGRVFKKLESILDSVSEKSRPLYENLD